jgi:threonine dehydrogenase-like Zn-dependent dehydrogenase
MRAVFVHGPQDFALEDVPTPVVGEHDALVAVRACGICGSDLAYIDSGVTGFNKPKRGPSALGHEAAGEVVAVGSGVTKVAVGDRVAINPTDRLGGGTIGNGAPEGALAELVRVTNADHPGRLIPLPAGLGFDLAALAEPLGVALHAVNRSPVGPDRRVVVLGVGPIGLGAVIWLKTRGVGHVVAVDTSESRLERARRLGADATIVAGRGDLADQLRTLHGTGPRGAVGTDVFIDAAGAPSALSEVIAMARFGAHLTVVAVYKQPMSIDLSAMLHAEMTLTTSVSYPRELADVVEFLGARGHELGDYISDRFSLDDIDAAVARARQATSAKVMVQVG